MRCPQPPKYSAPSKAQGLSIENPQQPPDDSVACRWLAMCAWERKRLDRLESDSSEIRVLRVFRFTLLETNMETQKGLYKDYSPYKNGLYGFPC